jgi:hypothetical protein
VTFFNLVKEFLNFWLIYVTLRLEIPVCFHKLSSESQQNRIKCRTLLAFQHNTCYFSVWYVLLFRGQVHHTSSFLFLNYRSFSLLGVWTWRSAYITNEEVHSKSSKGYTNLFPLCSILSTTCNLNITCSDYDCNAPKRI